MTRVSAPTRGRRSDPLAFVRTGYPVAAVFLLLAALGFGIAGAVAQATDPVPIDDVGSFDLPAAVEGRALYVDSDALDLGGDPPCQVPEGVLEQGSTFAFARTIEGQRTRVAAHLGTTEAGTTITCRPLDGEPGWFAEPAGSRWQMAALAVVLLVGLTFIRVMAGLLLGGRPHAARGDV